MSQWVKVRHRGLSELSPLLPQHRTLASLTVMSQLCDLRPEEEPMNRREFFLGGAAVAPPFLGPVARWLASKAPGRRL